MNRVKIPSPIVTVEWLNKNCKAENLLIFDATIKKVGTVSEENQHKEQIPNAIFFDIKNEFSDTNSKYPNTLLHPDEFEFKAQNLGVDKDSCIVVYDDIGMYSAPRVWWMFNTFGLKNIAVLDGGLPAWKKANLYTEEPKKVAIKKGDFVAKYQPQKIRFTEDVLASVPLAVCIADARSENRFLGIESEPRKDVRSGHIPSSVNIPYAEMLSDGKMKSVEELKAIFNKFNPNKEELIFSCGSGITACILALGAELAGIENYAVYDGSWSEWGSRTDLPIENLKNSKWSKTEFEAYVLLFCAQSNHIETQEERDYIISKVNEKSFNAIHTEIVHDTNEESAEKIKEYLAENSYSSEEKSTLLKDIKNVFFADGSVDKYEKHVFSILKKLLE